MTPETQVGVGSFDNIYYPQKISDLITKNTDRKMVDHIREANRDHLNGIAMTYMGISYTYSSLFAKIEEYEKALKAYGLNKGDCIIICLPNTPETVFYFYACNGIGIIPYMVDPRYTFNKISTCISDAKAKLLICEMGTYFSKIRDQEEKLPVNKIVVVSPLYSFECNKLSFKQRLVRSVFSSKYSRLIKETLKHEGKACFQTEFLNNGSQYNGKLEEKYDPAVPAIIVNTSGTSGTSIKGAMHSNKSYNILTNQITFISNEIRRGYTYYGYIPYFSMYGSGVGMHSALSHGIIIDNIPQFKGKKSILEILNRKANIIIGVPNLFESMVKTCKEKHIDMSFAKLYVMGGDNVAPDKLKKENEILADCGMEHRITYGYGSTEVMMVSTTSDDERSYEYGSCGIPYPGVEYRVVSPESGAVLSNDEEGEIFVHTPTMMLGYLNKPEESNSTFKEIDGKLFFKTGDKGRVSATGHLYLTGRYKRLMKRPDGHQVSPIPIENAIQQQQDVADCCVVGLKKDSQIDGVLPTAFIKLKPGAEASEKLISEIASKALALLSGERESALVYTIVETIPYTENGKMNYLQLEKDRFGSHQFYAVEDPLTIGYFKGMPNVTMIKL